MQPDQKHKESQRSVRALGSIHSAAYDAAVGDVVPWPIVSGSTFAVWIFVDLTVAVVVQAVTELAIARTNSAVVVVAVPFAS